MFENMYISVNLPLTTFVCMREDSRVVISVGMGVSKFVHTGKSALSCLSL